MRPAPQKTGTGYHVKGNLWAAGYHTGLDILTPTGTTLVAPCNSKIIHVGYGGWGSAYGLHVIGKITIKGKEYRWMTAHMKSISVKDESSVKIGQTIGKSDSTGHVTGPHCHFEVREAPFRYGDDVNPDIILKITDKPTAQSTDKMDPAAYFLGAHGPHITWFGERLIVHGFGDFYKTGPGPTFTEADERNCQAFQLAQGWKGSNANGLPGPDTLARLAAEPKPIELPKYLTVKSACINLAGLNDHGRATAASRIRKYCDARKKIPVHIINVQECDVASSVRPRMDSGLAGIYQRYNGGKARYNYCHKGYDKLKVIAHGLITTPASTWYRKDDKQASWVIYEIQRDGLKAIAMDVSLHLESDNGNIPDHKRVEQAIYICSESLKIAKKYKVPEANILVCGDTNSEGMVPDALFGEGWINVAEGTKYENSVTFMGFNGKSKKRFDYVFVRKNAGPAKIVALSRDTSISDHASIRFERQLEAVAA